MTEPTTPNADPNRETQTINPSDVGDAGAVLGLGGVAAQATVGALDPQPGAVPAADQPAGDQPTIAQELTAAAPAANTQEPTGTAPDAPAATLTATPGSTDEAAGRVLSDEARATVATHLNAIEQIALYWGGETGTKIRNHVGFIREQLQ